jgi:hypothetical protein
MQYLEKRDRNLQRKIDNIQTQLTYHMWISALVPIFGEPIREILTNLFNGNQTPQSLDQLLVHFEKKTKNLTPELKQKLMNTVTEHWNAANPAAKTESKTGLPKLDDPNTIL